MLARYAKLALWLVLANTACLAAPHINLQAVPSTTRVRQEGPCKGSNLAQICCARNEVESVQIVVTAVEGNLQGIDARLSPLQGDDSSTIPMEGIKLYRPIYVPIRHSVPRATCAPGWITDPLVPFINPYTGEPVREGRWDGKELDGARFGASGFELWQDHHQPLWLDVFVPKGTLPGTYRGEVTVEAKGGVKASLPLEVVVWDFDLPDGPTHENHFGGFDRVASYHGMDRHSDAFYAIEARYCSMMAEHRINPPIPGWLKPDVADDGTATFDETFDQAFTEFVEAHHMTNIEVHRTSDALAPNFYASWANYLERKDWIDRAYLYMKDEPNDAAAYDYVRRVGALAKEAAPKLRRLVVEQPYTQSPDWGTLEGAIDIWCPLFCFVHEPSIHRVQSMGDDVWSYTALVQKSPSYCPDYPDMRDQPSPWWEIDFPVTNYRVAPWLNRRYNITGLLYWSTVYWGSPDRNPWDDPGFRVRWNGEGALFYPGDAAGIEGPVSSIRLKNLRDGMEDYEYFVILETLGGKTLVDKIVREAVPTWSTWDQNPHALPNLRHRLAEAILSRARQGE